MGSYEQWYMLYLIKNNAKEKYGSSPDKNQLTEWANNLKAKGISCQIEPVIGKPSKVD